MVFFQRQAERSESYVVFVLHVCKGLQVYVKILFDGIHRVSQHSTTDSLLHCISQPQDDATPPPSRRREGR
jgi:hypothetical protein